MGLSIWSPVKTGPLDPRPLGEGILKDRSTEEFTGSLLVNILYPEFPDTHDANNNLKVNLMGFFWV